MELIEPHLGLGRATILDEYPIVQSPLARPTQNDASLAQRFELYACGIELANACGELTDAHEQRIRLERQMSGRSASTGSGIPSTKNSSPRLQICLRQAGLRLDWIGW